jgi:hypothetical protein
MTCTSLFRALPIALPLALGACAPPPSAPTNPTWADVEPILRGECNHCHGGSAATTGAMGPAVYRFDFYDAAADVCGEAMGAMDVPSLARGAASLIRTDVTLTPGVPRPRMPPAPAAVLEDWQRETLQRWAERPVKGAPPEDNRPPRLEVRRFPASANRQLSFVALLSDPDGQSTVGVLKVRNVVYKMSRPGSFAVDLDTSSWPAGSYPVTAIVCDGWEQARYDVGQITITH